MTPKSITVLIEGDEGELEAKLRFFNPEYNAGLYDVSDGREFYVDPEYIKSCIDSNVPVGIPLQVVTQRAEMLEKLRWGQDQLSRLNKQQESGIILPDGYTV